MGNGEYVEERFVSVTNRQTNAPCHRNDKFHLSSKAGIFDSHQENMSMK